MDAAHPKRIHDASRSSVRPLAEQAFSRAAGTPLVGGNSVRLLRDARENYPAWLEAINAAQATIHFESYIIHEDEVGREFAAALAAKAKAGVRVCVLYDWLGGLGKTSARFWNDLRQAGVEVRCFNPLQFDSPFGWLTRDHRKVITVDGSVAFVTGLCVGADWVGDTERNIEPWRDTGVELRGPAVAHVEQAFTQSWRAAGGSVERSELPNRMEISPAGDVNLRVIASEPQTAALYRLDQLIAAGARERLWLTDAYFVGTTSYVSALRAAARDGVDVRLLVPGASDIPFINSLSRSGYRPLLEAGVRVFEWNGSMLHAKTAVADGRWARVGSTNLNLASWIGNWELDVAIEDERFAGEMEEMYLQDLTHSTEIILSDRKKVQLSEQPEQRASRAGVKRGDSRSAGSTGRAAAGAIGIGNAVGAAITNHRRLGPAEAKVLARAGVVLLGVAVLAVLFPRVIIVPLMVLSAWIGIALLIKAYKLRAQKRSSQATLSPSNTQPANDAKRYEP